MNIKFTDEPEDADTGAGAGVTIPGAESLEVPDTAEAEQPLTPPLSDRSRGGGVVLKVPRATPSPSPSSRSPGKCVKK